MENQIKYRFINGNSLENVMETMVRGLGGSGYDETAWEYC